MGFIKYDNGFKIGDKVRTTRKFESCAGYFELNSIVTIVGISERGYDIADEDGNKITECGFSGFSKDLQQYEPDFSIFPSLDKVIKESSI